MFQVRPLEAADQAWVVERAQEWWGGVEMAVRGGLSRIDEDAGLVALDGGHRTGLLTYSVRADCCEITSLVSLEPGRGVGSRLLDAAVTTAARAGCTRVRVVTTNDNLTALRFYQRHGFALVELRPGAVTSARERLKPAISEVGDHGIPIRDELELERQISQ